MEKKRITVNVAGKSWSLVSSDPPEHVRRVAEYVDRRLSETAAVTNLPSAQTALLTCFNLADELMKAQDENNLLRRQMEAMRKA
ncbi:MAG: cell division protein ZapA [Clostridia bacterium]|nr:cell division protein ZapA [Clostridia bacterium]MBQ6720797.1 cell division protein ZapA [Clostridia bacterium]